MSFTSTTMLPGESGLYPVPSTTVTVMVAPELPTSDPDAMAINPLAALLPWGMVMVPLVSPVTAVGLLVVTV